MEGTVEMDYSDPFVDPEKPLLYNNSYKKDIFPDPHPTSLFSSIPFMNRLSLPFLSPDLTELGLNEPPLAMAISAHEKQRIGFIKLRLAPPVQIRTLKDLGDIILNHEFLRLLFIIVWFICCGFTEMFLAQISDWRYHASPAISKHPLKDLLHDAFPLIPDITIVNILLNFCIIYTVSVFAIQSPDWTTRFAMLRRFTFIMGFIYVFRGLTLLVTTLPSSLIDECRPPEVELSGNVGERFGFITEVISGTALTCTDNIFSGHTSMMMSCCMIWRVHSRLRRPFAWLLYAAATAGMLMILFTRFHYSIDVLLAIYITYTAWDTYLRYVREASMRYMFGFTKNSTFDIFNSQLPSGDANRLYQYLTWQPHPLGKNWLMWIIMYVDGLDIRLRALRVFDERGVWQSEKPQSMAEKKHQIQSTIV